MLNGKTVWVVEPERFTAYALERRLRDMQAHRVVLVHDTIEARARLVEEDVPSIAIVDCAEQPDGGRDLVADLRRRRVKVVCTVGPRPVERAATDGTDKNGGEVNRRETNRWETNRSETNGAEAIAKPYALIDVERAIARHYGLVI